MMTDILNKTMGLFISEQDEKADMDTKIKSLLINLAGLLFTLIVLFEGIWSLINEQVNLAIPFLFLGIILAMSYLYLKKTTSLFHHNFLLSIIFITCSFFIFSGGNTMKGIIWSLFFPFFAMSLRGRKSGTNWSLGLLAVIIIHFGLLQNIFSFAQTYTFPESIFFTIVYITSIIIAFAFQFIRTEVLLEKERIILDSQNQNKVQEELISKLSHQIRTPLSNITGILDMLESSPMNEEQRDYINTIHASANNLVRVVNNLVMASKTGIQETQEITNFNLYNTINNVLRLFPFEQSKTKFNLSLAADIPGQLTGNSIKLKQIMLNIFNSIIRHDKNDHRQITIEVTRIESMPERIELVYRIISNIIYSSSKGESEEFFYNQDFHRLNTSKIINFMELGITQKIIESDGHSLIIIPQSDKTTFEFGASFSTASSNFTSHIAPEKARKVETSFKQNVDIKNSYILLVEDNFSNQQIISLYIRNEVNKIDIAFNGKEALEKFGLAKYDLILMDVQMPIMDGFKATQKIREIEKSTNTHVPIIAVTANAFPEDKDKCLSVGMDDYISKPFQPEELISKIKKHLSN